MRLRTYSTRLVQIAGLVFAGTAAFAQGIVVQDRAYGVDRPRTSTPDRDIYDSQTRATESRGTVLSMPADGAPATAPTPDTPPRGMRKSQVRARYGAPLSTQGPVGQPPITRWDYADYRLYFEYDHVLHAVVPDNFEPIAHADQLDRATP